MKLKNVKTIDDFFVYERECIDNKLYWENDVHPIINVQGIKLVLRAENRADGSKNILVIPYDTSDCVCFTIYRMAVQDTDDMVFIKSKVRQMLEIRGWFTCLEKNELVEKEFVWGVDDYVDYLVWCALTTHQNASKESITLLKKVIVSQIFNGTLRLSEVIEKTKDAPVSFKDYLIDRFEE